jgi:hydroxyacylglutathione hydrolase
VVVDPQRDISQYLADAERHRLRIERIFETHFHADFVSGHLELADATGAVVTYGEGAVADFLIEPFGDGQTLSLGEVVIGGAGHARPHPRVDLPRRVRTRGGRPWGVLTGGTVFIGDVGRPDLLASVGWAPEQLARLLYRSIHDRLLTLPDATRCAPSHEPLPCSRP